MISEYSPAYALGFRLVRSLSCAKRAVASTRFRRVSGRLVLRIHSKISRTADLGKPWKFVPIRDIAEARLTNESVRSIDGNPVGKISGMNRSGISPTRE